MILVIDNYDSFVHNLARYVRLAGGETRIVRNDADDVDALLALKPRGVVISPGPKTPAEAGVSVDLIRRTPPDRPVLGVCLGHQCLVEAFGGRTVRARAPMHGRSSRIRHDGGALFEGTPAEIEVGRYHALASETAQADDLVVEAVSEEGDVMAVRHRRRPWFGVQFHPESVLTPHGLAIVRNFVWLT
ncbi:MAG: aminodeoxychorismate/anthranilate synthase component II [Pseudomonadota bacterium]